MQVDKDHKMTRSPIKWAGGKSRFRKRIISLLPDHSCYCEPFGGAGWVLFAKPRSDVEILNDINGELVNFFRVIKHRPEEFIDSFDLELVSREKFEQLSEASISGMSELRRAHRFFYLIMAGWGGEWKYHRLQTSVKDGGHGNRLIGAMKYLKRRIEPIHERLMTVIVENLDWEDFLDRYDRDGVIMYLDPPYPENGVNYADNMRDWEDHEHLAEVLKGSDCKWMLSSYNNQRMYDLYDGYNIVPVESYSGMSTGKDSTGNEGRVKNEEVLVLNYNPPVDEEEGDFNNTEQMNLNL